MFGSFKIRFGVICLTLVWLFIGCSVMERQKVGEGPAVNDLQSKLLEQEKEISELKASVQNKEKAIAKYRVDLENQATALKDTPPVQVQGVKVAALEKTVSSDVEGNMSAAKLLPPNAVPGECYSRVYIPPKYETVTEEVVKTPAAEKIELIPAKYEEVEEKVLVKGASKRLEEVPAKYEWIEEKVLVKEAHTVWKKGRGPIEKEDNTTGEIMCLVEVPATYKTVKKHVMVEAPAVKEVEIPAEYKTIKVKKMVSPPQKKVITIPAEYETVTKNVKISGGDLEWRRILCETNMTPDTIRKLQKALNNAGYKSGDADGIIGWRTMNAVTAYQKENKLATGSITYETLEKLGVALGN
jgi:uncharacterized coiled-coil protein SlyX